MRSLSADKRGFSLVEILVLISILAIIALISMSAFQSFSRSTSLAVAGEEARSLFSKARSDTLSSRRAMSYGVHVEDGSLTFYEGAVYSSTSPANVTYEFIGGVTAATSLTGDVQSVSFSRLRGEASATGTVVVREPTTGNTATVTIYKSGLIE
jgi:prepilin-type N-terminal cleavage/methylation domain-containing protein